MVVDARSVFDALAVQDICNPAEMSVKLHLISIRSKLESGIRRLIFWCGTRDMLSDALTKGGIDRKLLMRALKEGNYALNHAVARHSFHKA